jgi:hypothetical protein
MQRTRADHRQLLDKAGYVFDDAIGGWKRRGDKPTLLTGRVLDADVAWDLSREQIAAWIKAGEGE